jgi:hypothetical protein
MSDKLQLVDDVVGWLLMNQKVEFNWSDAWLLLGILFASNEAPATLETIIGACDGINISIIAADRLESGLVRLTTGGFIREKNGAFYPTKKLQPYLESLSKRRAMNSRLQDIQEILGAPSATSDQPSPNSLRYPGFSAEGYEKAVENYVGRVD